MMFEGIRICKIVHISTCRGAEGGAQRGISLIGRFVCCNETFRKHEEKLSVIFRQLVLGQNHPPPANKY
jgi:hypothetical protein